ncbi:MAG: hypothetical protein F6K10_35240, partial [Moorea sp. SIO2B7]|nr:hypothetical protein [Moorena sp. SIO2B7]
MKKKNLQETGKKLGQQLRQRSLSTIFGRINFLRTNISQKVSSFVPAQYRWMIPFLAEEMDLKPPTAEELKEKLLRKPGEGELEGEISEQVALEEERKPSLPGVHYLYPESDLPAILAPEREILGNRGRYQITKFLGYRGNGRLYEAIQLSDHQPILIKEYLLPKEYFNPEEIKERKEDFVNFSGSLKLVDDRFQDFRLINPWEAIADTNEERCYLVIQNNLYKAPTLGSYLAETGKMSDIEVPQVIDQVLQSLQFIHTQNFRLPYGGVESELTHGNLNLDTLLIVPNFQGFYIYLCDLSLWEERCLPPQSEIPTHSQEQDLKDLGYVAFYGLAGGKNDPDTGQILEPEKGEHWPNTVNNELKNFILNLIGFGFESAEIARRNLPPIPQKIAIEEEQLAEEEKEQKKRSPLLFLILGALGVLLLGLLIWFLTTRNRQTLIPSQASKESVDQVSGIPSGKFTYITETNGVWRYVLTNRNLLPNEKTRENGKTIEKKTTLENEIEKSQPGLQLSYKPKPSVIKALPLLRFEQEKRADFAVTTLVSDLGDRQDYVYLGYEKFAYDGLVVFVNFSYAERKSSLPKQLKGKISFEQLRQLYTGKIDNWEQLGGPDLKVKLYIPPNDEAVQIFEQRVLKDKEVIKTFRKLIVQVKSNESDNFISEDEPVKIIRRQETFPMLKDVIKDFENDNIGSIGFDAFSKVFGQCSVYPLALEDENQNPIWHYA